MSTNGYKLLQQFCHRSCLKWSSGGLYKTSCPPMPRRGGGKEGRGRKDPGWGVGG